ncbi:MAG TPA: sigma-70 family RNA polymerase sigma factor [Bacillales bacterium]|nr:sigma-70 family RNA polymerase sigma factor [Bacillales bacterium]
MENERAEVFLSTRDDVFFSEQAMEELMETYGQKITRLAYTYVKDRGKAEDIAQEVFIKCFTKLNQFRGEAALKTWIYRVTVNLCKDELKSWHARKMTLTDRIGSVIKGGEPSPEFSVVQRFEEENLGEAVMALPVKYREVIILYYYEDFSIDEISRLTGIRQATVKTRLRRARLLLEKMLTGEKGGDSGDGR